MALVPLLHCWPIPSDPIRILQKRRPTANYLAIQTTQGQSLSTASASQSDVRRLVLLRHAESSWHNRSLRDHDRPLSDTGQKDAVKVSQKLQLLGWIPQLIISRCMGHNRGWEEAASMLCGASVELKTCNAALLQADGKSWEEAFSLAGFGGWKLQGIVKPDGGL